MVVYMKIELNENNLVYSKLLEVPPMAKQSTNFNARTKTAYTSTRQKFTKKDKELIETYSNGSIPRTSRPDVQDNLNKALFDSLSFIKDDSYVTQIIANKVWSQYACIQLKLYAVDVPDEVLHLCHGKA